MITLGFISLFFCCPGNTAVHNDPSEATGTIRVSAQLSEPTPHLPKVLVDKNIPFCGETIRDPILLTQNGAVLNTVLSIVWKGKTDAPQTSVTLRLQTRGCLMEPRIQAARSGSFLILNSGDEITHNPHGWWNDQRTVFNLTLVDPSLSFKRKLKTAGRYRIDCDTHHWMKAYIHIFDHPYFALPNQNGWAEIGGVPIGKHKVKLWHEVLGELETELLVKAGETITWHPVIALKDHRPKKLIPTTVEPWPKPTGR